MVKTIDVSNMNTFLDVVAPKEVIMQIILHIKPKHLPNICRINKRIQSICASNEVQRSHKLKYPRHPLFERTLFRVGWPDDTQENFIQAEFTMEYHSVYTDGLDNWLGKSCSTLKYISRKLDKLGNRIQVNIEYTDFVDDGEAFLFGEIDKMGVWTVDEYTDLDWEFNKYRFRLGSNKENIKSFLKELKLYTGDILLPEYC